MLNKLLKSFLLFYCNLKSLLKKGIIQDIIVLFVVILFCQQSNAQTKIKTNYKYADSLLQKFIKDTVDKKTLRECDSLFTYFYSIDSNRTSTLLSLRITRAYLRDFEFLLARIYPKLYQDERMFEYEKFKLFEAMKDIIKACNSLILAEELLKKTNFNDEQNIIFFVVYIEVLYLLKGEESTNYFIKQNIINDSLPNHSDILKNPFSPVKKRHKKGLKTNYCECIRNPVKD